MNHIVAIIGSGVAGAEAAARLAAKNIECVVFEQNMLPYGKLESGLPKWHVSLRNMHEARIDEKLQDPLVSFVPGATLGETFTLAELVKDWKFSAVLLATGAWKDRSLPIEGIDDYAGKGLYYQNPFVAWYNHSHDPDYKGPECPIEQDAIVIGGGLASLDVVKILMIETVRNALQKKGIEVDPITLESRGIPDFLSAHDMDLHDLGVKPCTLFYRRKAEDMPLSPLPPKRTEESLKKIHLVRRKILRNLRDKFPFRMMEQAVPVNKIVRDNRLAGLVFRKTEQENGRVNEIPGSEFSVESPLVISAIGSIPQPMPGVPMKGNTFDIVDGDTGRLKGFDNVFVLGNAVTGRGNIRDSQLHGRKVADYVHDQYLAWKSEDYAEIFERTGELVDRKIENIEEVLEQSPKPGSVTLFDIKNRVAALQGLVGYAGNYSMWIDMHKPLRIEQLISDGAVRKKS